MDVSSCPGWVRQPWCLTGVAEAAAASAASPLWATPAVLLTETLGWVPARSLCVLSDGERADINHPGCEQLYGVAGGIWQVRKLQRKRKHKGENHLISFEL